MSVKVSSMVYERGPAVPGWRFLMSAMADNADDQGYCFPGVALLAAKTCASPRTVLRRIAAMEQAGWLTVERRAVRRRGTGAANRVNAYQLNIRRLRGDAEPVAEARSGNDSRKDATEGRRCDTVSHRLTGDDVTNDPASRGDDVTKTSRRCDKPGIAILINRQEPRNKNEPKSTPQPPVPGGAARAAFPDAVTEQARRVMRERCLTSPRLEPVIARALLAAALPTPNGKPVEAIATVMIANHAEYLRLGPFLRFAWGPRRFFADGHWMGDGWPLDRKAMAEAARVGLGSARAAGGEDATTAARTAEREAEDAAYRAAMESIEDVLARKARGQPISAMELAAVLNHQAKQARVLVTSI